MKDLTNDGPLDIVCFPAKISVLVRIRKTLKVRSAKVG